MVDPAAFLESDHRDLDNLLLELTRTLDVDVAKAFHLLDLFWARLAVHIRAEHLVVFPAVLEITKGRDEIVAILKGLRHDHDFFMKELARAIKAMRLMAHFGNETETITIVRSLIEGVGSRLAEHNRTEEELIYPLVSAKHAGDAQARSIAARTMKEIQNMPARFRETERDAPM
jgi:iron-sulfur cluster repair protein YtfE (RIC family)